MKGVHADFARSVREHLKLSQLEMAQLLETTDRTIRRWGAGVCNIPEDKLAKYHELKMTGVVTGSVTGVVSNACQNDDRSASEDQKTTQDAVSSSNKEVKKSIKDIKEDNVTRNDVTAKREKSTICSLEKFNV